MGLRELAEGCLLARSVAWRLSVYGWLWLTGQLQTRLNRPPPPRRGGRPTQAGGSAGSGLLGRVCATWSLALAIWPLEGINFAVHVILRPVPWNPTSTACGYLLWALQLCCFARFQCTDAGRVPGNLQLATAHFHSCRYLRHQFRRGSNDG